MVKKIQHRHTDSKSVVDMAKSLDLGEIGIKTTKGEEAIVSRNIEDDAIEFIPKNRFKTINNNSIVIEDYTDTNIVISSKSVIVENTTGSSETNAISQNAATLASEKYKGTISSITIGEGLNVGVISAHTGSTSGTIQHQEIPKSTDNNLLKPGTTYSSGITGLNASGTVYSLLSYDKFGHVASCKGTNIVMPTSDEIKAVVLPKGGTVGNVLVKNGTSDYDIAWGSSSNNTDKMLDENDVKTIVESYGIATKENGELLLSKDTDINGSVVISGDTLINGTINATEFYKGSNEKLASETFVNNKLSGYQVKGDYATKSDIDDLASETFVNNKLSDYQVKGDYATKTEVETAKKTVEQTLVSNDTFYPILLGRNGLTGVVNESINYENDITINPSKRKINGVDNIQSDSTDFELSYDDFLVLNIGSGEGGIRPRSGDTCDLGTDNIRFRDGYFSNQVKATNGFYQSSDERLKTFGDELNIDLDKLSQIKKSHFNFNETPNKQHIGVSAQEIQKLYPEVVDADKNGYLSVDYAKLSVVALAAIDKLNERIKRLEEKLSCS